MSRHLWRQRALADLDTVLSRDPSILSRGEALMHPCVVALWSYRLAHHLHGRGARKRGRLVSNLGRLLSGGIEIHPGASIGERFFVDHGAAVVIGETAVIGDDVTLFHQVTLGSVGWWHDPSGVGSRRHPALGDRVVVGANATLLGAITVGAGSVVGAQALVVKDVPADSRVMAPVGTAAGMHQRRTRTTGRRPILVGAGSGRSSQHSKVQPFPEW